MTTLEISQMVYKYLLQYKKDCMEISTSCTQLKDKLTISVCCIYPDLEHKEQVLYFKTDTNELEIKNEVLEMCINHFYTKNYEN